jgi:spore maturation protein CgeB
VADYDALFFTDTAIVDRYRRTLGLNAFFLPEACNPRWHRPLGDLAGPQPPSVLVAGNVYATRFVLLRELLRRGIEVTIYGGAWARWLPSDPELRHRYTGSYLAREDKARAFRSACVVLNSLSPQEGDGLNCRLFEATACGSIVLTEWRDRLPDFFEMPDEVRSYRDLDQLVAEVNALAALSARERGAIASAAYQRAHREHTYGHRFEAIVAALGGG